MIGRIAGMLAEKRPPQIVVMCAGVGYELDVPMSTFYQLPRTGESVELLTHQVVREDAHLLFGFLTESERSAFRQLLKISGAYLPPPPEGFDSPVTWGVEEKVIERFAAAGVSEDRISFARETYMFNFPGSHGSFSPCSGSTTARP